MQDISVYKQAILDDLSANGPSTIQAVSNRADLRPPYMVRRAQRELLQENAIDEELVMMDKPRYQYSISSAQPAPPVQE